MHACMHASTHRLHDERPQQLVLDLGSIHTACKEGPQTIRIEAWRARSVSSSWQLELTL
jgi:hypothetical protein